MCSYTSMRESGLFQLMPGDNMNDGGTTEALLRPACSGQTITRPFTDSEIREQMVSFARYLDKLIERAQAKLSAAGVDWPPGTPSFWMFVKLQHAYPGPSLGWLRGATQQLGHPPSDFAQMRSTVSGYASVLENAAWVGQFGGASGEIPVVTLALVAGAGLLYYLWRRRRSR